MRYLIGTLLTLFLWGTAAAEIMSVVATRANIRSAPSLDASYVVLEVPRYYPLLVQGEKNEFHEVRDYEGRTGWIHKSLLDRTKAVVVEVDRANVRKGPGAGFPVVFHAYRGVTFKVLDEKNPWLEVLHESGQRGWVYKSLTWGQ